MALKELYHPEKYHPEGGRMRVAGLMSGTGSNLRKIIEHGRKREAEEGRAPYQVVVIFSDNAESNAAKIGRDYDLPVIIRDIKGFYKSREKPRRDLSLRKDFDFLTVDVLKPFHIDVAAYAGYMSIATEPLINAFLGVNVHPADLSVMSKEKRKYAGDHAVRDAVEAGEKQLRASTHLIEERVDYGKILMISAPLSVPYDEIRSRLLSKDPETLNALERNMISDFVKEQQNHLKEIGDWVIFPRTLEYIADGRYAQDGQGNLYFDNQPIPQGLRLEEI